jgi:hypothetical protein
MLDAVGSSTEHEEQAAQEASPVSRGRDCKCSLKTTILGTSASSPSCKPVRLSANGRGENGEDELVVCASRYVPQGGMPGREDTLSAGSYAYPYIRGRGLLVLPRHGPTPRHRPLLLSILPLMPFEYQRYTHLFECASLHARSALVSSHPELGSTAHPGSELHIQFGPQSNC